MNMQKSCVSIALATSAALALCAVASSASAQPKPALTRDIDRPGGQPVHGYCVAPSFSGAGKCTLLTVPPGKRLVVETVSYQLFVEAGKRIINIAIGDGTDFASFPSLLISDNVYSLTPVFSNDYGIYRYSTSQPLKFYLEEGRILVAYVATEGSAVYSQQFSFSGFLVDK